MCSNLNILWLSLIQISLHLQRLGQTGTLICHQNTDCSVCHGDVFWDQLTYNLFQGFTLLPEWCVCVLNVCQHANWNGLKRCVMSLYQHSLRPKLFLFPHRHNASWQHESFTVYSHHHHRHVGHQACLTIHECESSLKKTKQKGKFFAHDIK